MALEGRLPRARRRPTARVLRAIRTYQKAFSPRVKFTRRRHYQLLLSELLLGMTRQELAEYYAGVRVARGFQEV